MIGIEELKHKINQGVRNREKFLFAINYEMNEGFFISNPETQKKVLWRVSERSNFIQDNKQEFELTPDFITREVYAKKFDTLYSGIFRGDSFLANLTIRTPLGKNLSLKGIAMSARSKYLLYVPNRFVCFSPEPFIRITVDGEISSFPMKGTIDASIPNAKSVLLSDQKEKAEHNTIVDLIRSDLSRVASDIQVESFRYIEELKTRNGNILQMSSKIKGKLLSKYKDDYANMIFELLPAGSISGSPKPLTIDLINSAEGENRGFYCGVFGYFDGYGLDSSVMIRYIEKEGEMYYYRSGGGITINSEMLKEYEEVKKKVYITK